MIDTLAFLNATPWLLTLLSVAIGLSVGSFLNVLIHRLPAHMFAEFRAACDDHPGDSPKWFGLDYLIHPPSTCPSCETPIRAVDNIPILSYLLLRGACRSCGGRISPRYPLVEGLTAVLTVGVMAHFGATSQGLLALVLTWGLITLTAIDLDHKQLPDVLTLPLLWLGLIANLFGTFTDLPSAVIGAATGYGFLWLVFHLFAMLTGKEGMGYGDFKLLAALGAWLGWQYLVMILLLSSVLGIILGGTWLLLKRRREAIPFGPYLAVAGWLTLLWGEPMLRYYLQAAGLD